MNTASTPPVPTTETATCSWTESPSTTMKPQVRAKIRSFFAVNTFPGSFLNPTLSRQGLILQSGTYKDRVTSQGQDVKAASPCPDFLH